MNYDNIKELAVLMCETDLTTLEYTEAYGEVTKTIKLGRCSGKPSVVKTEIPDQKIDEITDHTITSPMVGMFYAAASEGGEPYVQVGSKVKTGDILCIIEAMKIMNEITSEQNGTITEICIENNTVVEFGQPLFKIRLEA